MRIVIYGLNYHPDEIGVAKYTTELADWLHSKDYEVVVVTAVPYYPAWRVPRKYKKFRLFIEVINGVRVYRVPIYVPKYPGGWRRAAHLLSFAFFSAPVLAFVTLRFRPDIMLTIVPTLLAAPVARIIAAFVGCKTWLHVQDLEIDAALGLNFLQGRVIQKILRGIEKLSYSKFDVVSSISSKMVEKVSKKIGGKQVYIFRNWVDSRYIFPAEKSINLLRKFHLREDDFIVLYSGNISRKQGIDLILAAAEILRSRRDIVFVIAGDGPAKQELTANAHGLTNVVFLPLQPLDTLNDFLNIADVHVLPQRANASDLVLPSKLTGMMATGKPIVATAPVGSGLADEIADCGIAVPPEQPEALATAILELNRNPQMCRTLGAAARRYAIDVYDKNNVLSEFSRHCSELVDE